MFVDENLHHEGHVQTMKPKPRKISLSSKLSLQNYPSKDIESESLLMKKMDSAPNRLKQENMPINVNLPPSQFYYNNVPLKIELVG